MSEQITVKTAITLDVDSVAYALRDDPAAALAFVQRLIREVADTGFAVRVREVAQSAVTAGVEREREFERARRDFR